MNNFVEDFQIYCRNLESPTSYIMWSGFAAIAAVLRDNVYFQLDYSKIYPNIYVVLYATSGATRKGPPIQIAGSLIKEVGNTKFLGGRFSIQAAMKVLSEVSVNERGQRLVGGSCVMYSEELSALIAADVKSTIDILTDWYDSPEHWANNILANEGIQEIKNVCVTLLAASNSILFNKVFSGDAIYGGLLARTFLIAESNRRQRNSRMFKTPELGTERQQLMSHLMRLSKMKGEIVPTDSARKFYDDWYNSTDDNIKDRTGVLHRMHTGVIKLAIILAASEYNFNFVLEKRHFEDALTYCQSILKNYKFIDGGAGGSRLNLFTKEILTVLMQEKSEAGVEKRTMIRRLFGVVDPEDIDKAVNALVAAEYVENRNSHYILTDKFRSDYKLREDKLKEKT